LGYGWVSRERERESKIGWGWNNWVTLFCSQLFLQNKKIAAGIIFKIRKLLLVSFLKIRVIGL
jgi:hypothetical protein